MHGFASAASETLAELLFVHILRDHVASSDVTQALTGWHPKRAGLLDDIRSVVYAPA